MIGYNKITDEGLSATDVQQKPPQTAKTSQELLMLVPCPAGSNLIGSDTHNKVRHVSQRKKLGKAVKFPL